MVLVTFAYLILCRYSVFSVTKVPLLDIPLTIRAISSLFYLEKLENGYETLLVESSVEAIVFPIYWLFTTCFFS